MASGDAQTLLELEKRPGEIRHAMDMNGDSRPRRGRVPRTVPTASWSRCHSWPSGPRTATIVPRHVIANGTRIAAPAPAPPSPRAGRRSNWSIGPPSCGGRPRRSRARPASGRRPGQEGSAASRYVASAPGRSVSPGAAIATSPDRPLTPSRAARRWQPVARRHPARRCRVRRRGSPRSSQASTSRSTTGATGRARRIAPARAPAGRSRMCRVPNCPADSRVQRQEEDEPPSWVAAI